MAKNSVADWSTTAGNNTDVGGINIAEGCDPGNVNNGMREIMAQIAARKPASLDGATFTGTISGTNAVFSGIATAALSLQVPGAFRAEKTGTSSLIEMLPNSYFLEQQNGTLSWSVASTQVLSVNAAGAINTTQLGDLKTYIDTGDTPPLQGAYRAYITAKTASGSATYGNSVSGANLILTDLAGGTPSGAPGGTWRVMSATISTTVPALLVRVI